MQDEGTRGARTDYRQIQGRELRGLEDRDTACGLQGPLQTKALG